MGENSVPQRTTKRDVIVSLLFNGVLPLILYSLLKDHTSELTALTIASLAPILDNAITYIRHRHLDVFGVFMIVALLVSILAVLLGGSPQLLLVRESLVSGALGVVFLLTLFLPRPMLYYFALHFTAGNDPDKRKQFSSNWSRVYFRRLMYVMTIVWGLGLVLEALVRTYLVFQLSTVQFLAVSPVVNYGMMGALILWTVYYRKQVVRRTQATNNWQGPTTNS